MILMYVPELDNAFSEYWTNNGEIVIHNMPMPELEDSVPINTNSFIHLLFSNSFSALEYTYLFEEQAKTYFSKPIRERLGFSSSLIKAYTSTDDSGGINLYNLTTEELNMVDNLFYYRTDGTSNFSAVDYTGLESDLSKLIYIYLDFMVNEDFSRLNDSSLISSSDNILHTFFEIYVTNEAHKLMKNWDILIDSGEIKIRPTRESIPVTSSVISDKKIFLSEPPYENLVYLYYKGTYHEQDTDYIIGMDGTADYFVDWNTTSFSPEEDFDIHLEYNTVQE
ncbi:MAG: hypothetical protein KAS32_20895 [Candidatus Peribacteraceae bacterium]|nr:hypothetical protein [Candidatus Peribacteraceae bacterium]